GGGRGWCRGGGRFSRRPPPRAAPRAAGPAAAGADLPKRAAMTDIAQRNGVFHLEDLRVGQRFRSGTHALDEAQIKSFARQFDPQPFHVDDDQARDTLFAGLAASGWHTAAITMR